MTSSKYRRIVRSGSFDLALASIALLPCPARPRRNGGGGPSGGSEGLLEAAT
jgi:hypothetical protein